MTALTKATLGPALTEVCPAFAAKLAEYNRLLKRDPVKAERVFVEAQAIAKEFRAGAAYAARHTR